jgi:hypothetical protein
LAIDRKQLPDNAEVLQQMVLDLIAQLDASEARRIKTENLLRQLLAARSGKRSEQITDEQLSKICRRTTELVPMTQLRPRRPAAPEQSRVAAVPCPRI